MAVLAQLLAESCRPSVLPDDRRTGPECSAVPEDDGLPLIRDADAGRRRDGARQSLARASRAAFQISFGLVLDPACLRKILGKLSVATRLHMGVGSDNEEVTPVVPASITRTDMLRTLG